MSAATNTAIDREYWRVKEAVAATGLSKSYLHQLITEKSIASHLLTRKGKKTGARVIVAASLREWIAKH
jgi:hypothetical protein